MLSLSIVIVSTARVVIDAPGIQCSRGVDTHRGSNGFGILRHADLGDGYSLLSSGGTVNLDLTLLYLLVLADGDGAKGGKRKMK